MIERKPWHRQEDESSKAFHAFMLYRDMGAKERSLEKVLGKFDRKPSYYRHLARWSSRYHWVARATAYDDYQAEVKCLARERAIEEMEERQAKEGMALQGKGIEKLQATKPKDMTVDTAIRAVDIGVKIERTARGEPTEIAKGDHIVRSVRELSDQELDAIIQKYKQLEEGGGVDK